MTKVSVIIPTRNRSSVLAKTLTSLDWQTVADNDVEILVIDDGSTRQELASVKKLIASQRIKAKLLVQKHLGPAAARNRGIREAQGEIVLIINDDTVPHSDLLRRHLEFHRLHPEGNAGLLGRVSWYPTQRITPFMKWLENGGPYFSFNSIDGEIAGWQRLWTCNVSFKRDFLLENGLFDEEFPDAAWEDIELGYRLHLAGLKLYYSQDALGFHYHPTSIASIRNKMRANGRNLLLIRKKLPREYWTPLARHPRLAIWLDGLLQLWLPALLSQIFPGIFDRLGFDSLYELILLHYRISGLNEAPVKS